MKIKIPAWLWVIVIFFGSFIALEWFVDSGDRPAFIKYPILNVVWVVYLFILIVLAKVYQSIDVITWKLMSEEERQAKLAADAIPVTESAWYKNIMQKLTRSTPIESEESIMMNHDYDGIKELDNKLPPWWVYSFYITIIFSMIYLVRYHMMGAPDQEMELQQEIAEAQIAIEEYKRTAPDMMDEDKVTLLTDAEALGKGKAVYEMNCAACHRVDGGGQIGPNLTDDHWILGGSIKEVFHTINKGGRDGKGMIAWGGTLKPTEIQYVASYVLSLRGSSPAEAKGPEGDLVKPADAAETATEAATDEQAAVENPSTESTK